VDASTRWRDWENYDLVVTFKQNPLFGSGFGHPYVEAIKLPDITKSYELEPYIPHNSVLGLLGVRRSGRIHTALADLPGGDVLHRPRLSMVAHRRWSGSRRWAQPRCRSAT